MRESDRIGKASSFVDIHSLRVCNQSLFKRQTLPAEHTYNTKTQTYRSSTTFQSLLLLVLAPSSPRIHVCQGSLHLIITNYAKSKPPSASWVQDDVSRMPWCFLRQASKLQASSELLELFLPVFLGVHDCLRRGLPWIEMKRYC